MNENQAPSQIADTADCLEAVSAFKSFKNLTFFVSFVCLILLQAAFWMNYLGRIDKSGCCRQYAAVSTETSAPSAGASEAMRAAARTAVTASGPCTSGNLIGAFDVDTIVSTVTNPVLFSLNLLMSLKISIVGRLGGINHIARAFLLSLFLLVLVIPWQICLPETVVGAIYTPRELLCTDAVTCQGPLFDCIFYFGREPVRCIMSRQKVAFIGTGIMGAPMARNLLKAGYPLTVHSRTRSRAQPVIEAGASWADSPAAAAKDADVVITCVTDTGDVEKVLLGQNGVIESAREGLICIDMSTISPAATRRIGRELMRRNRRH